MDIVKEIKKQAKDILKDDKKKEKVGDTVEGVLKSVKKNVKDDKSKKWGIINLSKEGEIKQVLDFEYESVNYDQDTGYYILMKDNRWYVYNLEKKNKVSDDFDEVIYDVWENSNMNYYVKVGTKKTVGDDSFINFFVFSASILALSKAFTFKSKVLGKLLSCLSIVTL